MKDSYGEISFFRDMENISVEDDVIKQHETVICQKKYSDAYVFAGCPAAVIPSLGTFRIGAYIRRTYFGRERGNWEKLKEDCALGIENIGDSIECVYCDDAGNLFWFEIMGTDVWPFYQEDRDAMKHRK